MKELDDFVKIISNCFTEQVAKWKESDLRRVIDWADYFDKVNLRTSLQSSRQVYFVVRHVTG